MTTWKRIKLNQGARIRAGCQGEEGDGAVFEGFSDRGKEGSGTPQKSKVRMEGSVREGGGGQRVDGGKG